jgi:hypothetical protein
MHSIATQTVHEAHKGIICSHIRKHIVAAASHVAWRASECCADAPTHAPAVPMRSPVTTGLPSAPVSYSTSLQGTTQHNKTICSGHTELVSLPQSNPVHSSGTKTCWYSLKNSIPARNHAQHIQNRPMVVQDNNLHPCTRIWDLAQSPPPSAPHLPRLKPLQPCHHKYTPAAPAAPAARRYALTCSPVSNECVHPWPQHSP